VIRPTRAAKAIGLVPCTRSRADRYDTLDIVAFVACILGLLIARAGADERFDNLLQW
jgi:hypothetical protein